MRRLLAAGLFFLPFTLIGCSNCIDSGICPFVNEGPAAPRDPLLTVNAARSSNTDLNIHLDLNGISVKTPLEFIPSGAQGNQADPSILATADNGRVVVHRLSSTFTGPDAQVRLTVSGDVAITTEKLLDLSFQVRQVGTKGIPGIVSLFVWVQ
ncbi:hypothetical protein [Deinococcus irradiatisoli]|uniref:hypothetical protein n=1 Tax=Deinococcus irradiatisoli TaxID=2202254 RepID=UPI0011B216A2|nr:hypothetical protein [Deinococcus irradiatisoli]